MFRRVIATFAALLTAAFTATAPAAAGPVLNEIGGWDPRVDWGGWVWFQHFRSERSGGTLTIQTGQEGNGGNGQQWPVTWPASCCGVPVTITYNGATLSAKVGDIEHALDTGSLGDLNYIGISLRSFAKTIQMQEIKLDQLNELGTLGVAEGARGYWSITGKDLRQGFNLTAKVYVDGQQEPFEAASYFEIGVGYLPLPPDNQGPVTSNVDPRPMKGVLNGPSTVRAQVSDQLNNIASAQYCTRPKAVPGCDPDSGDWQPMSALDGNFDELNEDVTTPSSSSPSAFKPATVGLHEVCVRGVDERGNRSSPPICQLYPVGYKFHGFFSPIMNDPAVTSLMAGQTTVTVKWRLTDANDHPIDDPARIGRIRTYPVDCTYFNGDPSRPVDEITEGGLMSLGNGYWQYFWQTKSEYADTCRRMFVELNDGVGGRSPTAAFKFRAPDAPPPPKP